MEYRDWLETEAETERTERRRVNAQEHRNAYNDFEIHTEGCHEQTDADLSQSPSTTKTWCELDEECR